MKNYIKFISIFTIVFFMFLLNGAKLLAVTENFDTFDLTKDEVNQIWENIDFYILNDIDSVTQFDSPIVSFDISVDEKVLIGLSNNQIAVMNKDGDIINAFKFETSGSFYVEWRNDNIILYLTRSGLIVEISLSGQLISMLEEDKHSMNNNSIINELSQKRIVTFNDCQYEIKNNMGPLNFVSARRYSRLIKTDKDGNIIIIYDVNTYQLLKVGTIVLVIFLFVSSILLSIIRTSIKINQSNRNLLE